MASSSGNAPVSTSRLLLADGENKGNISGSLSFVHYRSYRCLYISISFLFLHNPPTFIPTTAPSEPICFLVLPLYRAVGQFANQPPLRSSSYVGIGVCNYAFSTLENLCRSLKVSTLLLFWFSTLSRESLACTMADLRCVGGVLCTGVVHWCCALRLELFMQLEPSRRTKTPSLTSIATGYRRLGCFWCTGWRITPRCLCSCR